MIVRHNGYAEMLLPCGASAKIDIGDIESVARYCWRSMPGGYVIAGAGSKTMYLHRYLLNPPKRMWTDHKNGDKKDCRRSNIRICTPQQNNRNKKLKSGGIKLEKRFKLSKPWMAEICVGEGERVFLGTFATKQEALDARQRAAETFFGEFARKRDL